MVRKEQHLPLRFHPATKPCPVSSEIVFPSSSTSLPHQGFFNALAQIPTPGSNPLKSGKMTTKKYPTAENPRHKKNIL